MTRRTCANELRKRKRAAADTRATNYIIRQEEARAHQRDREAAGDGGSNGAQSEEKAAVEWD